MRHTRGLSICALKEHYFQKFCGFRNCMHVKSNFLNICSYSKTKRNIRKFQKYKVCGNTKLDETMCSAFAPSPASSSACQCVLLFASVHLYATNRLSLGRKALKKLWDYLGIFPKWRTPLPLFWNLGLILPLPTPLKLCLNSGFKDKIKFSIGVNNINK